MEETVLNHICEQLLHAGWKLSEIEQLWGFLDTYVQTSMDQADLDIQYLEFIRWLVLTGRLKD
jgi:hypothetical protein